MFGFLNINKPSGITSHKVISVLRKITGIKQIGHAGTLDPLAQGVLPVAIGKASKLIDYLDEDKSYEVTMQLGFISDTYDIEGNTRKTDSSKVNIDAVTKAVLKFKGVQKQIPPAFSAVHYNGKRLYELARNGKIPENIPAREITVYKIEIIEFDYENQILKLDISCSKGTYIRSIVNDIGQELKTGAVMTKLIRTKSSGMFLNSAITLSDTTKKEDLNKYIINPVDILTMEKYELSDSEVEIIKNGNKFKNKTQCIGNILLIKNKKVAALAQAEKDFIQPKKVLLTLLFLIFSIHQTYACDIVCPIQNNVKTEKESFINNITGIGFFSKKIVETIIQNELKEELTSNFKADLELFNIKQLKSGEFKYLKLQTNNIKYKALSLSDFQAQTICDYNKIIYKNKRIKYPTDIAFKFSAQITNQDIQNIINSVEFQKEIQRNQNNIYKLGIPNVEIKDSKVYFKIPIKTVIGNINIKLNSAIKVENNKLVLTNTTFSSKSNIINESMISSLINKINPMEYITSALNGKYYSIYIDNAITESDKLRIDGKFTINKNYGGENE